MHGTIHAKETIFCTFNNLKMKYLTIFISGLLFICGLFGLIVSGLKIAKAVSLLIENQGHPGFYLMEAIDTILLSIVIFILSGGIYKLFVGDENTFSSSLIFSKLTNFKELKVMLWEALLLTLTVWCVLDFYFNKGDQVGYQKLILPVTIVLLALGLRLIKSEYNHK